MKMDRPMKAKTKPIDTDNSSKQGRMTSNSGGGAHASIPTNDYGHIKVPQSKKLG